MRRGGFVLILAGRALLAQTGQEGPRPEWPCVPGRPVDPAFLEASESTGGQLFLFQKSEFAKAGPFLSASHTHPATVLRSVGSLNGSRDFEFAIDSTVKSLLVMSSLQCRSGIGVFRPGGTEITAHDVVQDADLQTGRLLRVDEPEAGRWKVRLAGSGLFVLSVQVNSSIDIHDVRFLDRITGERPESSITLRREPRLRTPEVAQVQVSGELSQVSFQLAGPSGERLAPPKAGELQGPAIYRFATLAPTERFRIVMTGLDAMAQPVERTYPVLFRAPAAQ